MRLTSRKCFSISASHSARVFARSASRFTEPGMSNASRKPASLYLSCLFAQTALIAGVGGAVIYFSNWERDFVPQAIGFGIIFYALAVAFYTILGIWRLRRSTLAKHRLAQKNLLIEQAALRQARNGSLVATCSSEQPQPQGK